MEETNSFVSHVFNFEQDSRNEMVNIMQYTVLAIVFITILNRGIQDYMPEVDKDKGSLAIFVEISIQCIILFVGILFIHRIITFIPTISGAKYADQNIITIILPTLILLLSITKLGDKVSVLLDRFAGSPSPIKIKYSQPLASAPPPSIPSLLPKNGNTANPMNSPEPDFNTMFAGPNNPLQNAQSPDSFEPMPSNFGGSIF
jgi:hypothetical protein